MGRDSPGKKDGAKRRPTTSDFSNEAVGKIVNKEIFQHWSLLYPAFIAAAGGLGAFLISPFLFGVVAAGGVGAALLSVGVNYFRKDAIADRHIKRLLEEMAAYRERTREELREELAECRTVKGGEGYAEQGEAQFSQVQVKFEAFTKLLAKKLDPGEMTFNRYLGTAEQLYLAVMDNLRDIVNLLKSVDAIDIDYIAERFKALEKIMAAARKRGEEPHQADSDEVATLNKSKELYSKNLELVNVLLTKNEEALTQLDEVTAAIAREMRTTAEAKVDMETARKQLEELARRARDYSNK